jgi:uncharacterized cupredoxin-like copper-binding protein
MNIRLGARIGLLVVALTVAALSWQAEGASADEPVQVGVTLKEFTLTAAPTTAAVGNVQFNATNQGVIAHEVVVLKTDLATDALPRRAGIDRVDEAASGEVIGEIEDTELGPGHSANAIMDLAAGRYILLCNLEGHYTAGMYTVFTVGSVSTVAPTPTAVAPTPTAVAPTPTAASLPQAGGTPGNSSPAWIWLAAGLVLLLAASGWLRLTSKLRS